MKNDVSMLVGPTRDDGSVFVSADEIIAEIDKVTSVSPMDYRPDTWTRTVEARVMTATDVHRFEQAVDVWGDTPHVRRSGEVEMVRRWGAYLTEHPDQSFDATGEILGSEIVQVSFRPATWIEENRDKLGPR